MAEVFAAELCADTSLLRQLQDALFHIEIAKAMAQCAALCWQRIEIARTCEFGGLYSLFG